MIYGTMVKGTDFEIPKEVYDRAQEFNGHITEEDQREIFPGDLYWGHGVYRVKAYEKDAIEKALKEEFNVMFEEVR